MPFGDPAGYGFDPEIAAMFEQSGTGGNELLAMLALAQAQRREEPEVGGSSNDIAQQTFPSSSMGLGGPVPAGLPPPYPIGNTGLAFDWLGAGLAAQAAAQAPATGFAEVDIARGPLSIMAASLLAPAMRAGEEQKRAREQQKLERQQIESQVKLANTMSQMQYRQLQQEKLQGDLDQLPDKKAMLKARADLTKKRLDLADATFAQADARLRISERLAELRERELNAKDKDRTLGKGLAPQLFTRLAGREEAYTTLERFGTSFEKTLGKSGQLSGVLRGALLRNKSARTITDALELPKAGITQPEREFVAQYNAILGNLRAYTQEVGVLTDADAMRIIRSIGDPSSTPKQFRTQMKATLERFGTAQNRELDILQAQGYRTGGFKRLGKADESEKEMGFRGADDTRGVVPAPKSATEPTFDFDPATGELVPVN